MAGRRRWCASPMVACRDRGRQRGVHAARLLVVLLVAVVVCASPTASAKFTAVTSNASNSFVADSVAAPTGLGAAKVCVPPSTGPVPTYQGMMQTTGSGSSVMLTKPAGTVSGDLLLIQIGFPTSLQTVKALPLTTGWSVLRQDTMLSSNGHSLLYFRVAGGAEPASYTVNLDGSAQYAAAILRFSGVDTRNPFDALAGTVGASSTSIIAPAVTTLSANVLLVSFAAVTANTSLTPAGGMTEIYDFQSGGTVTVEAATQSFVTAGGTGTRTATAAGAGVYAAELVALRPAGPHAAPLYVDFGAGAFNNSGGGSVSITKSPNAIAGDLVVIGAAWNGGTGNAPATPSGWTQVRTDANGSIISTGWWYRVLTGAEGWPLTFGPSTPTAMTAYIYTVRNVNAANPVSGSSVATGTGTTLEAPPVAATDSHTTLISLFVNNDSFFMNGPVPGAAFDWASELDGGSSYGGNSVEVETSHALATSTPTPAQPWDGSAASRPWIATALAINPAPDTNIINATLSWTASTTAYATGYTWERWTGALQNSGSVAGRFTITANDTDALVSGTLYTYKLRTDATNWYSAQTTTTLTPTCP